LLCAAATRSASVGSVAFAIVASLDIGSASLSSLF